MRQQIRVGGSALFVALAFALFAFGIDDGSESLPALAPVDLSAAPRAVVKSVSAGNELVVMLDGAETRVRLIGTFVPGRGAPADEARAFADRLLVGETVALRYEPDWPMRDDQERVWAYAYRLPDGMCVNVELVRLGFARLAAAAPFPDQDVYRAYERHARHLKKGIWARPAEDAPAEAVATSRPAEPQAEPAAAPTPPPAGDPGQTVYITRTGDRYHRAECRYARGAIAITLQEARARKLTPCKACRPPE